MLSKTHRALLAVTLMLVLGFGGVTTAVQAATDGPAAAAQKKNKKKKKKKAKTPGTQLKDGTYEFTASDNSKVTYTISGKGTKVGSTYTFFSGYAADELEDPDSCAPRTVTFPVTKLKRSPLSRPSTPTFFFQSKEIQVPAGMADGGANGGIASYRGEWLPKNGMLDLDWKINMKNRNDADTCFQYPSETAHPRKDKRK